MNAKPKFTWKDAIYLAVLAVSLGVTIAKFSERVTLLEATVERHEEERKLYNIAVIATTVENIQEDVTEIKQLVKDMQ
ncbi:hypothetical protein LCGC14_1984650 [marine sediment metagenome]|uniref:Uncharacterized protein n=1 Tax=marine sediment metagenome TaxID=412755 RepID=A0A0F9F836_9ZZZZ